MNDVLVAIGEALIDFIPDNVGCSFDEVTAFIPKIGGAPANVCGAFTKLGGKSRMLTQLGDDPFGHKIISELKEVGIDTSCISLTKKANTALAFVSLGEDGERTFSFYRKPSADMLYTEDQVKESFLDNVFALHFCSVSIGNFPMKEAHKKAIEIARKKGGIISFDPNLRFNLWEDASELKKAVREFIPLSDIVKISDEELEFVTEHTDIQAGVDTLFAQGVKLVLYTCGKNGAYVFSPKAKVFAPSVGGKAKDTTGAGDGFAGAFLRKLQSVCGSQNALENISEEELRSCAKFANEFCAISVMKPGAIASYPTLDEMQKINFN